MPRYMSVVTAGTLEVDELDVYGDLVIPVGVTIETNKVICRTAGKIRGGGTLVHRYGNEKFYDPDGGVSVARKPKGVVGLWQKG